MLGAQHESELENQCRFLDASLEAGNKAAEDDIGVLRAKLEHIISNSQHNSEDAMSSSSSSSKAMGNRLVVEKMEMNPPHQTLRQSTEAKETTVHDSLRKKGSE